MTEFEKKLKPAQRFTSVGGKFGQKPGTRRMPGENRLDMPYSMSYLGFAGGAAGGMAAGSAVDTKSRRKDVKAIRSARAKQGSNTRAIRRKQNELTGVTKGLKPYTVKGPTHRITDMGTKAQKYGLHQDSAKPLRLNRFSDRTKVAGGIGAAVGGAYGIKAVNEGKKTRKKTLANSQKKLKTQEKTMRQLGIHKSAFGIDEHDVAKSVMAPNSVPQGQRKRQDKRGKYKDKPKIGRGQYVKAPLVRDKVTKPRWAANALVNNPGTGAAGAALGGAAVLHATKGRMSEKNRRRADVAEGALIGGAAAHGGRTGADYGAKEVAERQFKPLTNKGNYGPYKDTPHKPVLNKYKREAQKKGGSDVRAKAKYFDENFPKGIPSHNARKVGVALNKKPVVAGAVAGGAAIGAGVGALNGRKKKDVKKSMTASAFGIEH